MAPVYTSFTVEDMRKRITEDYYRPSADRIREAASHVEQQSKLNDIFEGDLLFVFQIPRSKKAYHALFIAKKYGQQFGHRGIFEVFEELVPLLKKDA